MGAEVPLCFRCKTAKRAVSKNGHIDPYCPKCRGIARKERRAKNPDKYEKMDKENRKKYKGKASASQKAWREKNKGRVKQYRKEYCLLKKEEVYARNRSWTERNKQRLREYHRTRYHKDVEKAREKCKRNYRANPAVARARCDRYRVRKAGCEIIDPSVNIEELCIRDGWICKICGGPVPSDKDSDRALWPSIDHKTPISKGGNHTWDNVQLAHLGCNCAKRDRI